MRRIIIAAAMGLCVVSLAIVSSAETLIMRDGTRIEGTVRAVAPSVDPATRNGLVYVDLPPGSTARAGTFARGEFQLVSGAALTVPQSAVVLRDGFAYVFVVSAENRVMQSKVEVGRRVGERIEIVAGMPADGRVVECGAGLVSEGAGVLVVESPVAPVKAAEK